MNSPKDDTVELLNKGGFLCLVESSGNQQFLFSTNRLRDNLGASHLLKMACGDWLNEAAGQEADVHCLYQTSGRAILIASERRPLERVVEKVTLRALSSAPGLTVTGAIAEWNPNASDEGSTALGVALRGLSVEIERRAGEFPAVAGRFHRLPPVAICADSQFPAEHRWRRIDRISEVCLRKRDAAADALNALDDEIAESLAALDGPRPDQQLPAPSRLSLDDLDDLISATTDARWFATVHIDGNAIGAAFLEIGRIAGMCPNPNLTHHALHKALSEGLDAATRRSLARGIAAANDHYAAVTDGERSDLPGDVGMVLPLVYGGDDVTVLTDGRLALAFTVAYLESFEVETRLLVGELRRQVSAASGGSILWPSHDVLTAAAGIAVHKPHHPFYSAYSLADDLIRSAKRVARLQRDSDGPAPSTIDVHQLSDSGGTGLADIRQRRRSGDGAELWGGPYAVGSMAANSGLRTATWLATALRVVGPRSDSDFARRSLGKLRAAAFDGAAQVRRAIGELQGTVPEAILEQQDVWRTMDGVTSSAIVDISDFCELWG